MQKYVIMSATGHPAFYMNEIHGEIPSGAVEISDAQYDKYFSDPTGQTVNISESGKVTIKKKPAYQPTAEHLERVHKANLDALAKRASLAFLVEDDEEKAAIKKDYAAEKKRHEKAMKGAK